MTYATNGIYVTTVDDQGEHYYARALDHQAAQLIADALNRCDENRTVETDEPGPGDAAR